MNESALINKVWNYATIMKDAGLSYTDYVRQLTYLLFLKMDNERETLLNEESIVPQKLRWNTLLNISGAELEHHYSHILEELSREKDIIGTIFRRAKNEITDPAKLNQLIKLINKETWLALDMDVKGKIYEGLLQKNATETKAGAGQYFTPRPLIRAMVEVMRPSPEMTVVDPACGTGGFLLAAYDYMRRQTHDRQMLKDLRASKLYGNDITPLVVNLCAMNLYLHGIGEGKCPIEEKDSLLSAGTKRYDMCLTNPPFGKKSSTTIIGEDGALKRETDNYERQDFIATTSNKQINFLQHIMTILKTPGYAAVVVPDNVLFEGGAGEKVRKRLLNEFNLHTVLRLPTGIFYAQGVKANVIFFEKHPPLKSGHITNDVWVYDLRTNMNLTLVENSLTDTHLADFVKCYCPEDRSRRKETERFKKFTYNELVKRDKTNLDIIWLKDDSLKELENLPEPEVLLKDIIANLKASMAAFEELKNKI
ncbi:MAG: SAM-dependent DNA methyltransferase [Elusimicrobiales bacterium]|nr:SAM-dependent DNA methyltransferase [Elusimicrobiales bacterium]